MRLRWAAAAWCAPMAALALLCSSCGENEGAVARERGGSRGSTQGRAVDFGESFERIRLEAEAAAKVDGAVMRIVDDPEASGGKCIEIPDKAGKPEEGKVSRAAYIFTIRVAGNYMFWCRRKWFDQCGDTLAVRFDKVGAPHSDALLFGSDDSSKPPRWAWSPVFENGKPRSVFLGAGEHTMEILNREDGPRFDVILLTNDADYVPQGMED